MDLHVTVTVLPGAGEGVTVVVGVMLMTHVPDPQGNNISGPDRSSIRLSFVDELTMPLIWSVCPNAIPPNMHPATTAHIKIFTFMPPLNSQRLHYCKLLLVVR
jgi:hypothetical protein